MVVTQDSILSVACRRHNATSSGRFRTGMKLSAGTHARNKPGHAAFMLTHHREKAADLNPAYPFPTRSCGSIRHQHIRGRGPMDIEGDATAPAPRRSRGGLILGVVVVLLLAAGAVYWVAGPDHESAAPQ